MAAEANEWSPRLAQSIRDDEVYHQHQQQQQQRHLQMERYNKEFQGRRIVDDAFDESEEDFGHGPTSEDFKSGSRDQMIAGGMGRTNGRGGVGGGSVGFGTKSMGGGHHHNMGSDEDDTSHEFGDSFGGQEWGR